MGTFIHVLWEFIGGIAAFFLIIIIGCILIPMGSRVFEFIGNFITALSQLIEEDKQ